MIGPLAYLDAVLMGVPPLIGLLATWRGLARSLLSMPIRLLVAWWIAVFAHRHLLLYQPALFDRLGVGLGVGKAMAQVIVGAAMLLAVLIALSLARSRIMERIAARQIGLLDRLLAFAFGASVSFSLMLVWVTVQLMSQGLLLPDARQQPPWLRHAVTAPLIIGVSEKAAVLGRYLLRLPSSR